MKKRQLVYVPEIHPTSFVLLFEKGMTGTSFSVRDYSNSKRASVRYAGELNLTLSAIRERAMRSGLMFDAPTVATTDGDYWHPAALLATTGDTCKQSSAAFVSKLIRAWRLQGSNRPGELLSRASGLEKLKNHAKWFKRQDQERILRSSRSEDWVTWNAFALLTSTAGSSWWPRLLSLARKSNSNLSRFPLGGWKFPKFDSGRLLRPQGIRGGKPCAHALLWQ